MTVHSGQSILDIAVQTAGGAEAAFSLAAANGLSVTDELYAGRELETVPPIDGDIFNYYVVNGLKPATSITSGFGSASGSGSGEPDEGIEFWFVEYDFEVG